MDSWQAAAVGLASMASALAVVATRRWHGRWTGDFENSGVQKHHTGSPPRVGFLPLVVGVLLGIAFLAREDLGLDGSASKTLALMLLASLPVVMLGLADDVTKRIRPRVRLAGAVVAGLLGIALLGLRVVRVDIPALDILLAYWPVSVAVTVLMVCGFTNAMNIVDGLNGLSGGLAVLMLCATAVVAARFGDAVVLQICLVLAVAFHPTMETIFSIYRRRLHGRRRGGAMSADRLHLHTLLYRRRALRLASRLPGLEAWVPNAGAAATLLAFAALPMLAATAAPGSRTVAAGVIVVAMAAYLGWFKRLVGFGSCAKLRLRRARAVATALSGPVR